MKINIKSTLIYLTILILTIGSYYVVKQTNIDEPTQTATTTKNTPPEKIISKSTPLPVVKKANVKVITPGPLEVKTNINQIIYPGNITVAGVIERTNYERQINSLSGLTESSDLDASAQIKANDILARQYFEHTAPDGKTVTDLVSAEGYTYVRVGENLALGDFNSVVDLLTAWMNSPGHRANILDTRYQDIGVGIAYGNYQGRNVLVAVQHFGRPRSSCPSIDDSLKTKITDLQSQATIISTALDTIKARIDEMRANGEYVDNSIIDAYNANVTKYESLINQTKTLRDTYNNEVINFNACIATL